MDKHTIFYDAECPICIREIALILEDNRAEYFKAVAIQGNEEILKQYGITAEDALTYLHILRNDGVMLGKMPAVRLMYRGFKGFALVKLANLPLLDRLADLTNRELDEVCGTVTVARGLAYAKQGRVVELRDDEGLADIDRLATHYTGRPYRNRERRRISAWIEIDRWHGWGAMRDDADR